MEEEGLKIETETMEEWRDSQKEQPDSLEGKRRRRQDKVEWKKNVFAMINFNHSGILRIAN